MFAIKNFGSVIRGFSSISFSISFVQEVCVSKSFTSSFIVSWLLYSNLGIVEFLHEKEVSIINNTNDDRVGTFCKTFS